MDGSDGGGISAVRRGPLVLDVVDEGPRDGTPVVLLHGFPQRASCWSAVVPHLHAAGLRTLALDQRGYSPGARPSGRAAYRTRELVDDVCALLDLVGGTAHLVGHDWGAVVGWALAGNRPERVRSWTAVSVGHPRAFARALRDPGQLRRSLYMGLFQLPVVPEWLLGSRPVAGRWLGASGMTAPMVDTYVREIVADGALPTALSWYRAMPLARRDRMPAVSVPTTFVWSDADVAVGRRAAVSTEDFVTGDYTFLELPGVSHWVPEEAPEELAAAVVSRVRPVPAG